MKVKVLKLGHAATEVEAPAGATVQDVVSSSGFETEGFSITLNGTGANLTSPVRDGDIVSLVPKIEGGL